jgi:hypothetical protein
MLRLDTANRFYTMFSRIFGMPSRTQRRCLLHTLKTMDPTIGDRIEHNEPSREDSAQRAYELYVRRGSGPGKATEDGSELKKS